MNLEGVAQVSRRFWRLVQHSSHSHRPCTSACNCCVVFVSLCRCPPATAGVAVHVMVRGDARLLDIVSDWLPWFRGAQLAIDTTLISFLHCDGTARPGTADTDGAALMAAGRRKERTYSELVGPRGRARLVVCLLESVGKSEDTPGASKHQRVQQAWRSRWQAIMSCAAAKAFARSWLEMRAAVGANSDIPASHGCVQGPAEWG